MLPTPPDNGDGDAPRDVHTYPAAPDYVDADGLAWWFDLPPDNVACDPSAALPVRVRFGVGWRQYTPDQARGLAAALAAAAHYCETPP